MTTRRQVLQGSLATIGLTVAGNAFAGAREAPPLSASTIRPVSFHGLVVQPGLAQSAAFAAAAQPMGLPLIRVGDDITPVWSHVVKLWRRSPVAIAGLTAHAPLFLLEQSGRDHGMRVVFRAEHRVQPNGLVEHYVQGPAHVANAFEQAVQQESTYGAGMARALARFSEHTSPAHAVSVQTRALAQGEANFPLYSWVLAPQRALGSS